MDYFCHMTLAIPVRWRPLLTQLAREKTTVSRKRVTVSELIRQAVEQTYGLDDMPLEEKSNDSAKS